MRTNPKTFLKKYIFKLYFQTNSKGIVDPNDFHDRKSKHGLIGSLLISYHWQEVLYQIRDNNLNFSLLKYDKFDIKDRILVLFPICHS